MIKIGINGISDVFSSYHPSVNFAYFGSVILLTVICMHPVMLAISFFCSFVYGIVLTGKRAVGTFFGTALPVALVASVVNPLFSHRGATILLYFPSGNPLTLESLLYGLAAGVMLASVLMWFISVNEVMTGDKLICVTGNLLPSLTMLFTVTLRFVPLFTSHLKSVSEMRKCLLGDPPCDRKRGIKRTVGNIKNAVVCFVSTVTWSIENSLDTSDSMRARGYGSKNIRRTFLSGEVFEKKDISALVFIVFALFALISGRLAGFTLWDYYPEFRGSGFSSMEAFFMTVYFALCAMPVFIDLGRM